MAIAIERTRWALQSAGGKADSTLAEYAVRGTGSGNSSVHAQAMAEIFAHQKPLAHQRASEEYACIDPHLFLRSLNETLIQDFRARIKAHPAEGGRLFLVGDPHFDDYFRKWVSREEDEDGNIAAYGPEARGDFACHNPKGNTQADEAVPFLCLAAVWRSGNQWHTQLVELRLLTPLTVSDSLYHAAVIRDICRKLRHRVRCVLVDSWYDDQDLRARFRSYGLRVLHKLRLGPHQVRYFWTGDEKISFQEEAECMPHDESLPARPVQRWGPDGAATSYPVKVRRFHAILGEAPPHKRPPELQVEETIEFQVAVMETKEGLAVDWERTSAVVMNGRSKMGFAYYVRWNIETLFQVLVDSEPKTREQLISRLVVNIAVLALLVSLVIALRQALAPYLADETLGGVPFERHSVRSLIQIALHDPGIS